MLYDGEYSVCLVPFPGDIKAAVRVDCDGYPTIYINQNLSPEARKNAFLHEMRHILHNDFYNNKTIREAES